MGVPNGSLPDSSTANSDKTCLYWLNVQRAFKSLPLLPNLDYTGFTRALNDLIALTAVATSVWSAADAAANGMTLSNGGLTVTPSLASWNIIRSSAGKTSGKLYVEFLSGPAVAYGAVIFGVASSGVDISNLLGNSNYSAGIYTGSNYVSGFTSNYTQSSGVAGNTTYGIAIDFSAGSLWFSVNNVWVNGSNPATGSLPIFSFVPATVGPLFAGLSFNASGGSNGSWTLQPTAASQKYAAPSGFTAWG